MSLIQMTKPKFCKYGFLIKILKLNEIFLTFAPKKDNKNDRIVNWNHNFNPSSMTHGFSWYHCMSSQKFGGGGGGGLSELGYPHRILVWKTQTFGLGLSLLGLGQPRHLLGDCSLNIKVCILQSYTIGFFFSFF